MEGMMASIIGFAGNFAPRSWAFCEGQLIPIAQNTALFSLLGTIYGGDGRTTFALPDYRGRTAISSGRGPGLTDRRLGSKSGVETDTINVLTMPQHNHTAILYGENANATSNFPENNMLARSAPRDAKRYAAPNPNDNKAMSLESIVVAQTGSGASHENMSPWLAMHSIICLQGFFPSRS